jgi:hypothetical protein
MGKDRVRIGELRVSDADMAKADTHSNPLNE